MRRGRRLSTRSPASRFLGPATPESGQAPCRSPPTVSIEETLFVLLLIARRSPSPSACRHAVHCRPGHYRLVVGLLTRPSAVSLSSALSSTSSCPSCFRGGLRLERASAADSPDPDARRPRRASRLRAHATGLHLLGGTTWVVALLFGALIAAADPVTWSPCRRFGVPSGREMVEAEGLLTTARLQSSSPSSSPPSSTGAPSARHPPSAASF